jgi:hypothetical protein
MIPELLTRDAPDLRFGLHELRKRHSKQSNWCK